MSLSNNKKIPYGRQDINQEDIDQVVEILRSDFLTQGPAVPAFESAVAKYCGAKHAVAVNSATSALHIACIAMGVGPGDLVWTSPITFVASSNCALYCGASVDFVDIDYRTYNMSVEALAEKLYEAKKTDTLPKVVIPVHLSGQSCDMASIYELSQQYGFDIIEDASHALGGRYKDEPIGNGRYSAMSIFSFHPVKMITSGEGGMVVTNDSKLLKNLRIYRSHGITSNSEDMHSRAPEQIWNYQQIGLGFNYRMTDIQAALGLSQLKRLDEFVTKRQNIAKRYDQLLMDLPVITPWQHEDSCSSYHLYLIQLECKDKNAQHRVFDALREDGVLVNLHYIPVYRQPYYEQLGFKEGHCPEAEKYYKRVITIPIYTRLLGEEQDQVVESIQKAVNS
jgi:UDP-4-amino-4,6-dideoxy-N-acetyl-beta-L-altrosamine transaminase